MSDLASRLAALRRQAGGRKAPESPTGSAPTKPRPALLRTGSGPAEPQRARLPTGSASGEPQPAAFPLLPAGAAKVVAASGWEPTPSAMRARDNASRSPDLAMLRRMAGVRERIGAPRAPLRSFSRDVPGDEISPGLRYLEERFAWPDAPGELDLGFSKLEPATRDRFLHFDTETTGLAGGTGTRAFMIGAADWHQGMLRVRQLYITAMSAETAMLRTFAGWVDARTVLVSYNGKSYDAPLLATRYRLARLPNPLLGLPHVDLLHPMRRRYRHAWENCKMQTAERKLLRIVREDDLPGSEAPRAWLTYLRGGSSTDLIRVAAHNLQDVRSLSGLLVEAHGWAAADAHALSLAGNEK